jgi:alkylresorcinol/alkylpyrone synthase
MHEPRIIAVATATPPIATSQRDARAFAARLFAGLLAQDARLLDIFDHAQISTRYSCVPIDWIEQPHSFAEKNARYVEEAVRLACEVCVAVLRRAGLAPADIDHVIFVSSTGIATPSIDAMVANRLGFRGDVRRTPVWGLGCAGGAAGLSRARDFALADPQARVLLVALELCSLTFLNNDFSKRNLVALSLFGDGAAAAIVAGGGVRRNGGATRPLQMRASRSTLWKDTLDVMGWEMEDAGLRVVFSRSIPSIVLEHVRPSLEAFLADNALSLADVRHVVAHPGGIKVLQAYAEALSLDAGALVHARDVLRRFGNMSSPSCLFVLERFLESGDIAPGDDAVIMALGPGFSAEYLLVRGEA